MTVAELKLNQKGTVVKINGKGLIRKRLSEMGIVPGTLIRLERIAPLGDTINIRVKGYHLLLRKNEAKMIEINLKTTKN